MSQAKLIAVMIIVALVDLGLFSFACYLVYKIYKLIHFRDLPMLLSIISITLALICFEVYSILLIVQANLIGQDVYLNTDDGTNILRIIDFFKVMFTFCAFVFDLYKWCIFITATSTDVS